MPQPERLSHRELDGPFVQLAVFCTEARKNAQDEWSISGIHSGVVTSGESWTFVEPVLTITISGGNRRGAMRFRMMETLPGRSTRDMGAKPDTLVFDGPAFGHTQAGVIHIPTDHEGVAWYDIYVDDRLLTRMPFHIQHER